jgi:hypothetical protein
MKRFARPPKASRFALEILGVVLLGYLFPGCSGGGGAIPLMLFNIDNSTTPASSPGQLIEINGSGFGTAPGSVSFTQGGTNTKAVIPASIGWTTSNIVVSVPTTGSGGAFVPGAVTVTVTTSGGVTSNGVVLTLVSVPSFSPSSFTWGTTTALPAGLKGHGAAAIANTATSAYLVVVGGATVSGGTTTNVTTVLSTTINQDGTLGATWIDSTSGATQNAPLPSARAYHAMVEADSTNSPVAAGSAFVYVIAGQLGNADTPGGTSTVYLGTFSLANGNITGWATTSPLPIALVAPAATVYNGYVYVLGGLQTSGTPISTVYSAAIQADGTLSAWTTAPVASDYPMAISFGQITGFGGNLYAIGGGTGAATDPNSVASPTPLNDAQFAPVSNGSVGAWTTATGKMNKGREKFILWKAFGQVIVAEGVGPTLEMENSTFNADSSLASFNGQTGSKVPGANVYNSAGVLSPIRPPTGGPRFIMIGGEPVAGGNPVATIWYNTAP